MLKLKNSQPNNNPLSLRLFYILAFYACSFLSMADDKVSSVTVAVANSLATTGVLQELAIRFQQQHPEIKIHIQAVGSLEALERARNQQADLVITHFPLEEKRLVQQGIASKRTQLIESKFALFGPSSDDYQIKEKTRITSALKTLADNEAVFITPSAKGGTYAKIKELWSLSGIHPNWIGNEYAEVSSLGAMMQAAAEDGYTIADLGTYLSNKSSLPSTFVPLYQNDIALQNIYSVLVVKTKSKEKDMFYRYIISPNGQLQIKSIARKIYNAVVITPISNFDPELISEQKTKKIKQQNTYLIIGFTSLAIIIILLLFVLSQKKHMHNLLLKENEAEKENQRLQKVLYQAQKMESLGKLTGGIAHDFNNLLSVIIGYSQLSTNQTKKISNEKFYIYMEQIHQAGVRAKNLVAQMLTFSRNKKVEDEELQISSIISSCSDMLRPMLTSSIQIKLNIEKDIPQVLMNKTQLEQIIMNLAVNARDAMNGQGTLTINLSYQENMSAECNISHKTVEGNWVVLSVSDEGCGISESNIKNIFDPFFTTKEVGQGTGMGLSTIYGIVFNHDGHIIVDSKENIGTTFHILFSPLNQEQLSKAS